MADQLGRRDVCGVAGRYAERKPSYRRSGSPMPPIGFDGDEREAARIAQGLPILGCRLRIVDDQR
jgi:hypothetical protein